METKDKHKSDEYFLAKWMSGELTDEELKSLVPKNQYFNYLKIRKALDVLDELNTPDDNLLKEIKRKAAERKRKKKINFYKKITWGIAASLILFFGISRFLNSQETIIQTHYGEHKSIVLPDGSQVVLNAKSELRYNKNNWKKKRELFLNGEAYFKVTKLGNKFTVKTRNGDVTVMGTQFDVNSIPNYFQVVCYEGKVKVSTQTQKTILTTGKGFVSVNSKNQEFFTQSQAPEWTKGISSFEETPLNIVMTAIEKQYGIHFVSSMIDKNAKFTGSFTHNNLKLALASVFKAMKINYQIKKDTVFLKPLPQK